jgi:hypothetical protein
LMLLTAPRWLQNDENLCCRHALSHNFDAELVGWPTIFHLQLWDMWSVISVLQFHVHNHYQINTSTNKNIVFQKFIFKHNKQMNTVGCDFSNNTKQPWPIVWYVEMNFISTRWQIWIGRWF